MPILRFNCHAPHFNLEEAGECDNVDYSSEVELLVFDSYSMVDGKVGLPPPLFFSNEKTKAVLYAAHRKRFLDNLRLINLPDDLVQTAERFYRENVTRVLSTFTGFPRVECVRFSTLFKFNFRLPFSSLFSPIL